MGTLSPKNVKPTPGYVLVEPATVDKKTQSGIYLPDSHDEKPQHGKVLAIGGAVYSDGQEINSPVKVSDVVIYKKWGGNELKMGEIEYQFLKFEDILALVK